jgi:hypothetical protein
MLGATFGTIREAPPRPDYLLDDGVELDPEGNEVVVEGIPVVKSASGHEVQIDTLLDSSLWTVIIMMTIIISFTFKCIKV